MLQTQQYIVIIITLLLLYIILCLFKKLVKEINYIFIVCYISLISYFWSSSFVSVHQDTNWCHFISIIQLCSHPRPLCYYCYIVFPYAIGPTIQFYTYQFVQLLFKSVKRRKNTEAFILSFKIT